jgi:hypothetical protein
LDTSAGRAGRLGDGSLHTCISLGQHIFLKIYSAGRILDLTSYV